MKCFRAPLAAACLVAVLVPQVARAQAPNPRLGTWKLNTAKSKYDPGPAPKSETRTYAASAGDGITVTVETVLADGTTQSSGYTAKYDGKDYPYTGPDGDTISLKGNGYSTEGILKKAGKVAHATHSVVSTNGKTMTLMTKGRTADGKPLYYVRVYDKQ